MIKVSIVVTLLNEEKTMDLLLWALLKQVYQLDEVILVDGGSTDQTLQLIKVFQKKHSGFPLKLIKKISNRSKGRNIGIKAAKNEIIALTDAGCIPNKYWLANLLSKKINTQSTVVAGYYTACPHNHFEAAVVPYMLVMPDKIQPFSSNAKVNDERPIVQFLPATRSMLLERKIWQQVGGFDEKLTVSEDYAFAKKLIALKIPISFAPHATVAWLPIKNLTKFFVTVKNMARFDAQAKVTRLKVYAVLLRYLVFIITVGIMLLVNPSAGLLLMIFTGGIYLCWAVWKNAQYLDGGWGWLALLQVVADVGVMVGFISGKV